jgi:hypothetical protein
MPVFRFAQAIRVRTFSPAGFAFAFEFLTVRRQAALQYSMVSQSRAARRENSICLPHTLQSRRGTDSHVIASTFVSDILTLGLFDAWAGTRDFLKYPFRQRQTALD